jgi:hypothetical protein
VAAHAIHSLAAAEDHPAGDARAVRFPQSYLYCSPKTSGIWVRVQMECRVLVTDTATGQSDEYVLGVMAKTGLSKDAKSGVVAPGYDYSIIFSKDYVFTKRSHSSAYLNNPTLLTLEQFGEAKWHLHEAAVEPIDSAASLRAALEGWRQLTARTTFTSDDGKRAVTIEYPVKWADFNLDSSGFRVETGPVILLDPNQVQFGTPPLFADFQWAHFDYHTFDTVRCLMEQPTSLLADATFTPPNEDGREARETTALTPAQVATLRQALHSASESHLAPETIDHLLTTDHYSLAKEFDVKTEIYAFVDG